MSCPVHGAHCQWDCDPHEWALTTEAASAPPIHLSPVRRTGRLLILLRSPRTLDELQAELGISASRLRVDLRELREEGWPIEETASRGRTPKHLWLTLPVP